jgi:hypothetical protein
MARSTCPAAPMGKGCLALAAFADAPAWLVGSAIAACRWADGRGFGTARPHEPCYGWPFGAGDRGDVRGALDASAFRSLTTTMRHSADRSGEVLLRTCFLSSKKSLEKAVLARRYPLTVAVVSYLPVIDNFPMKEQ